MALLKKTIFDSSNLNKSTDNEKGGQYGISLYISPPGNKVESNRHSIKIEGVLKSAIDWNVNATWENINPSSLLSNIAGSNGLLDAIDTGVSLAFAVGGTSYTNTGLFTRKYYKNSGYLNIKPSFRIFDYENIGAPVKMGLILSSLCLATINPNASMELINEKNAPTIDSFIYNMGTMTANGIIKAGEVIIDQFKDKASEEANSMKAAYTSTVNNFTNNGINAGYAAIKKLTGAKISLSNGPDTVIVELGNWLRLSDMVVDRVNVTYSEQMTDMGPLYADIDIQLSSLEAMAFNEDGNISQMELTTNLNKTSKVTFTQTASSRYQGQ